MPEVPQPEMEYELPMGVLLSAPAFQEATEVSGSTRAWVPPSGYYLYNDISLYDGSSPESLYRNFSSLITRDIDAFFTSTTEGLPLHARLQYLPEKNHWNFTLLKVAPDDVSSGDYYVYGFIPRDVVSGVTITKLPSSVELPSPTYEDGAVLNLKNLRPVGDDVSVIIGAENGYDNDHDGNEAQTERLNAGDFSFYLKTEKKSDGSPEDNFLFLLFDHLYSAMVFNLKVDADYNRLRTIKVKELHLQTGSETVPSQKVDVSVTLKKTTDSSNPISSIDFAFTGAADGGSTIYSSGTGDGVTLTTNYSDSKFLTHVMPKDVNTLVMTWKYDIYDKNAWRDDAGNYILDEAGNRIYNLIRKDQTAVNTISLKKVIDAFPGLQRGKRYTINLIVRPTYLYMMSEPDLKMELDVK